METTTPTFGVQVPDWYKGYVNAIAGADFITVLKEQFNTTPAFLKNIKAEKWDYAYAPEKWTIKQLMIHLTDAERVFAYRALRFARNDATELAGFDENEYAVNCMIDSRTPDSIINEYHAVRSSTITLFDSFNEEALMRKGIANGKEFSVRLLGVVIAGHQMHHMNILSERYLSA